MGVVFLTLSGPCHEYVTTVIFTGRPLSDIVTAARKLNCFTAVTCSLRRC